MAIHQYKLTTGCFSSLSCVCVGGYCVCGRMLSVCGRILRVWMTPYVMWLREGEREHRKKSFSSEWNNKQYWEWNNKHYFLFRQINFTCALSTLFDLLWPEEIISFTSPLCSRWILSYFHAQKTDDKKKKVHDIYFLQNEWKFDLTILPFN